MHELKYQDKAFMKIPETKQYKKYSSNNQIPQQSHTEEFYELVYTYLINICTNLV